jgi:hypothetical protein
MKGLQPWARHDEFAIYMASIAPVFNGLNSLTGLTAGLLLLAKSRSGFETLCAMRRLPHEAASDCLDQLEAMQVPSLAKDHHRHLKKTAALITAVAQDISMSISRSKDMSPKVDQWCKSLESACRMLRCSSNPLLGVATVDFANGCACCLPATEPPLEQK